mmetsp:Transcript_21985/g.63047  ORF Transcript_21985/g.63047 Transcript_21985/m.63047 type:complete len:208 (-) Transcript_21985:271-894(-)
MDREVQNVRIIQKDRLRSIAVVHIPVNNQSLRNTKPFSGIRGGNGNVVDVAVSAGKAWACMVPRRPYHSKAIVQFPRNNVRYQSAKRRCGIFGGRDCTRSKVDRLVLLGFAIESVSAGATREAIQALHVSCKMNTKIIVIVQELINRCCNRSVYHLTFINDIGITKDLAPLSNVVGCIWPRQVLTDGGDAQRSLLVQAVDPVIMTIG